MVSKGRIRKIGDTWYIDLCHDGQRIRRAVGTRKDAQNALAAVRTDCLRGEYKFKRNQKIKFEDFAEEYLNKCSRVDKKPKSALRDESSLKHLNEHFKGMLLSKITTKHIDDYKKARLEEVRKVGDDLRKPNPATINRELNLIQAMFTVAKKWKKFDGENPVKESKKLAVQEKAMRILNEEEAERLISVSTGYTQALTILALNTAMRKGELLNLRWNDVDFAGGFIHIKESKSNKMRKVPMNSTVVDTIRSIKKRGEFVFHNPKTETRITEFYRSWKTACKDAGISDLRFHDLRHTAATWMVQKGIDLITVKDILGHADIKMTVKYAHSTPDSRKRAVQVLETILRPESAEKIVKNVSKGPDSQQESYLISRS